MTKVLHIITDTTIGGSTHHLLALLDAMDSKFVPEVILPTGSRLANILDAKGITYHTIANIAVKDIVRIVRAVKPNVVHSHGCAPGIIAARKYGRCKIITTMHHTPTVSIFRKIFPFSLFSPFKSCDAIIATSPHMPNGLVKAGAKKDRIHVIQNGMPPARSYSPVEKDEIRSKYNIPADAFVVAYVSRLGEAKGHDFMLDTAKELPFNVITLFVGDGEQEAHLRARVQKENLANVKMLGFIKDVDEIFAIMDIQVNAAQVQESVSLSLLFGMSVGKPAVVTNGTGNANVISDGENGLVVPYQDTVALDDAITRLKDDPGMYKTLSQGALDRYNSSFTATGMAQATAKLYSQ